MLLQAVNSFSCRLLDAVAEQLPNYQVKEIHDIVGFQEKHVDALGEVLFYQSDYPDLSSEWVEETLSEIFHRRKLDVPRDRNILFLFRLLSVKYRIHFPVKGRPLKIDGNILIFLEKWICQAYLDYYVDNRPGFKFVLVPPKL